jgi:isoleucyl-tRNA synthetase
VLDIDQNALDLYDKQVSGPIAKKGRKDVLFPADLVTESQSEHRGWLLMSTLTSVALTGQLPFKHLKTQGLVLNEELVQSMI